MPDNTTITSQIATLRNPRCRYTCLRAGRNRDNILTNFRILRKCPNRNLVISEPFVIGKFIDLFKKQKASDRSHNNDIIMTCPI